MGSSYGLARTRRTSQSDGEISTDVDLRQKLGEI